MINYKSKLLEITRNKRNSYFYSCNSETENVFHFIHVGRCGGSVIKKRFQEVFEFKQISRHSRKIITDHSEIWFHSHKVTLKMIPKGHKIFFVTRDPIDRFISGFNRRYSHGSPKESNNWNIGERKVFTQYTLVSNFIESLFSSNEIISMQSLRNLKEIKHLGFLGSYWDYFGDKKYLESRKADIFCVLCLDNLEIDFYKLLKLLKISNIFDLPPLGAEANTNPIATDSTLINSISIDKMKTFLTKEYDFLKYCKENNFYL